MCKNKHMFITLMPLIMLCLVLIFVCFFKIIIIDGQSMEPTLKSGQYTIVYKNNDALKINDIIVFHSTDYGTCVKRIVAANGDQVKIEKEKLYINGMEYLGYICENTKEASVVLDRGEYFVLGDNANASIDSREIGIIKSDCIIGKLIAY